MNDKSVALYVLKLDKSKYSNPLHNANIPCISMTLEVLKLFSPFISFKLC